MQNVIVEHIVITPDTCGGRPRVAGRRITVAHIAIDHERLGKSADQIASDYGLQLSEVYAALAYYFDNRRQIDDSIAADERVVAAARETVGSKIVAWPHPTP
jgi:uncharacterized protein (DUF433 family)